jgi:20S proteasome subunit alpha 2
MGDYNFSLTTFSRNGKLVQIEYALNAVNAGTTSIGIKASNGVVLATEKKIPSVLIDDSTVVKTYVISERIGLVFSGMSPDARVLVRRARKMAETYHLTYGEEIPVTQLVKQVAAVAQEFTHSGGVRPFGVSLLVAGYDGSVPKLYQIDPSAAFWPYKACAIGKNNANAKTFLEKRCVLPNSSLKIAHMCAFEIAHVLHLCSSFPKKESHQNISVTMKMLS